MCTVAVVAQVRSGFISRLNFVYPNHFLPLEAGVSEEIRRICNDFDIRVTFRTAKTVRSELTRVKDPLPLEKQLIHGCILGTMLMWTGIYRKDYSSTGVEDERAQGCL